MRKRLSYEVNNLQGMGGRDKQEDSFAFANATDVTEIRLKGLFAVVADGMGGMESGEIASQTAAQSLRRSFFAFDTKADMTSQLVMGVRKANKEVHDVLEDAGGSTIVACVFFDGKLHYASLGDSFLFLYRNNAIVRINSLHNREYDKYLEDVKRGSMDPRHAREDHKKEALTQYAGMGRDVEPDCFVKPLKLAPGDIVMLCSDGVGAALSEGTLSKCMRYGNPADICRSINECIKAKADPYQDNYTALCIRCDY